MTDPIIPPTPTVFQKIIDRESPAEIVWEDDEIIAFKDAHPQAPVHVLVIPKKPISSIPAALEEDTLLLGKLLRAAAKVAQTENIGHGFRLVINTGSEGGETVPHLHIHLLGGRQMAWPPG